MAFQCIDEPGAAKAEDACGKFDVTRCAEEFLNIDDGAVLIIGLFHAEHGNSRLIHGYHGAETGKTFRSPRVCHHRSDDKGLGAPPEMPRLVRGRVRRRQLEAIT